jgi:tetratricopeptide (TPR) repeat protein
MPAQHALTRQFQADHAMALALAGQRRQAQELLEALLPHPGSQPDMPEALALYAMGAVRRLGGDSSDALRYQRQALLSPATGRSAEVLRMRILTEIGSTLLDRGRPDEAAASFKQALALSEQWQIEAAPDRQDIVAALGRCLGRQPAVWPARRCPGQSYPSNIRCGVATFSLNAGGRPTRSAGLF